MRRSRFRRILAALIATLAATAASVLLAVSASSAATTSTPAPASHSNYLVTKTTAPMQKVRVTRLVSSKPDKAGRVRVQLANGAIVPISQAVEKKVMSRAAQEAVHPNGVVYGDCGSSYITLSEKPDGNPVAMRTGFTVYTGAISYSWSASVTGPGGYSYDYESGGSLNFDTKWDGGYQSSQDQAEGTYSAAVASFGSVAVLWDFDICFSGGPTDVKYLTAKAHCLNAMPAGAFISGGGWIENTVKDVAHVNITTTPNGPGTRASTATSCLTNPLGTGSVTNGEDITGLEDAILFRDTNSTSNDVVSRCHLIANQLGGKGRSDDGGPANLVPCWQYGANTGPISMQTNESDVYTEVTGKNPTTLQPYLGPEDAVYYVVTPNYHTGDSTIPYQITMTATVQRADGTSEPLFSDVVSNTSSVSGLNLGN
jgi:hypothetical protein